MKKVLCLLLAFWLPLFFSAASIASTSMQLQASMHTLASAEATSNASANSMQHCEQHMADMAVAAQHHMPADMQHDTSADLQHGKCQDCGLCLNLVYYQQVPVVTSQHQQHVQPQHVAWISTSHLPTPDQRPPIAR